jgi:NAD(P)-dependent dehydrogenase (short-subunit alcohol dehydrogenase family)
MSSLDLTGKLAVVTGAAGGIGAAACRAFARHGAAVAVTDRDRDAAAALAEELSRAGAKAAAFQLDVGEEGSVREAFAAIDEGLGPPDILVNNAGISIRKKLTDLSLEEWELVQRVNMTGIFLCTREALARMIPRRSGNIVNLASIMGLSGGGGYANPAYKASKGALVNFTRALAVEHGPDGIRVNGVAPTWVRTPLIAPLQADAEAFARLEASMPLRRIAEAEEIADAILFLASPMASMITGHTLPVDGGFLAQ